MECFIMEVCSVIINFNDGACGILSAFKENRMIPGYFAELCCVKHVGKLVQVMNNKSSDKTKK